MSDAVSAVNLFTGFGYHGKSCVGVRLGTTTQCCVCVWGGGGGGVVVTVQVQGVGQMVGEREHPVPSLKFQLFIVE